MDVLIKDYMGQVRSSIEPFTKKHPELGVDWTSLANDVILFIGPPIAWTTFIVENSIRMNTPTPLTRDRYDNPTILYQSAPLWNIYPYTVEDTIKYFLSRPTVLTLKINETKLSANLLTDAGYDYKASDPNAWYDAFPMTYDTKPTISLMELYYAMLAVVTRSADTVGRDIFDTGRLNIYMQDDTFIIINRDSDPHNISIRPGSASRPLVNPDAEMSDVGLTKFLEIVQDQIGNGTITFEPDNLLKEQLNLLREGTFAPVVDIVTKNRNK